MQPYSQFLAASQSKIFTCAPAILIPRCIPQLLASCSWELMRQLCISSSFSCRIAAKIILFSQTSADIHVRATEEESRDEP